MPNWCHDSLYVKGEPEALEAFVLAARTDEQPLSFEALCPQPSDEELAELETYQPCTMCGAFGDLPVDPEQARERGARWYEWMRPSERKDRDCNVCGGNGRERTSQPGWYEWRLEHWGCKWDANFNGEPLFAFGDEGADVDATTAAQGVTSTPTVAVYKFDTPWGPPSKFVEKASELYPDLEFELRFGELGAEVAGSETYMAGICVDREDLEVGDVLAEEEMWF